MIPILFAALAALSMSQFASADANVMLYATCTGTAPGESAPNTLKLLADIETIACAKKAAVTTAVLTTSGANEEVLVGTLSADETTFNARIGGMKVSLKLASAAVPAKTTAVMTVTGAEPIVYQCSTRGYTIGCP